jgi:hypothetical protein
VLGEDARLRGLPRPVDPFKRYEHRGGL